MHAVAKNIFLSDGKIIKKIDKKKFEKNCEIPFNLPIFVKDRLVEILIQKMHTAHEEKKILPHG